MGEVWNVRWLLCILCSSLRRRILASRLSVAGSSGRRLAPAATPACGCRLCRRCITAGAGITGCMLLLVRLVLQLRRLGSHRRQLRRPLPVEECLQSGMERN